MTPVTVSLAGSDVMKDSPFRDPKGRMPKWLEIEAELGYLSFSMKEIHKRIPKSALHRMIDDSSGFTDSLMKETLRLAERIVALKEALEVETGQKADTAMEKEIISVCSNTPTL